MARRLCVAFRFVRRSLNLQPRVVQAVRHSAIRRGRVSHRFPAVVASAALPEVVAAAAPVVVHPFQVRQFTSGPFEDLGSEKDQAEFNPADPIDDIPNSDFRKSHLHPLMRSENKNKVGRSRECVRQFNKWKKDHVAAKRTYMYLIENLRSKKPFASMTLVDIKDSYLAIDVIKDFATQFPEDRIRIQKFLKAYRDFYLYISNFTPLEEILSLAQKYDVDVGDQQQDGHGDHQQDGQ